MQRLRIESPRKTGHHLQERRSMVSCLQFHITNLVLSKCQKLVKTKVKLNEKLKPTHRYRKVPYLRIAAIVLKKIHRKVAFSSYTLYVWTIAESVTDP